MLVADRYDEYTDVPAYGRSRFDRYSRYDRASYDDRYEATRRGTSDAERERLMASLEKRGTRTRVERCDESRYAFYAANSSQAENNYDRMLERRGERCERKEKKVFNKRKTPLVVAYIVFALVAVLAVTLSLAGMGKTEEPVEMSAVVTPLAASAEESALGEDVAAVEDTIEEQKVGGEGYVLLKSGEIVAVEVPEITEVTEEKEKGFDKFCSWLNKIFGGKE